MNGFLSCYEKMCELITVQLRFQHFARPRCREASFFDEQDIAEVRRSGRENFISGNSHLWLFRLMPAMTILPPRFAEIFAWRRARGETPPACSYFSSASDR